MTAQPDPVFTEPWHAQVFALTVYLNEAGQFDWPDWATQFGAMLKQHGLSKDLDGGHDYFIAWLDTLEQVLAQMALADPQEAEKVKADWEAAYLRTPHGAPVSLDG
ncbi:nitrile hydratase accessory protein [Roseobacter sp.]|uniref:nitrile hydratase accessory protein n=1 Tax=Roseobacter sp. TaxID=1907202 RepID=UPI00329A067A